MQSYTAFKLLDYTSTLVTVVTGAVASYNIEVDEMIILPGFPNPVINSTLATPIRGVFRGTLDKLTFHNYTLPKYTLDGTSTYPVLFSTMQPRIKSTTINSDEALYFFQHGFAIPAPIGGGPPEVPRGRIIFYDRQGGILATYFIDVGFTASAIRTQWRVNLSPGIIAPIASVPLADIGSYTFALTMGDGTPEHPVQPISELMTYVIDDTYCNAQFLHVYFVNKFGAIDTYSMVFPENTVEAERTLMQRNPWQLQSDGFYSDFDSTNKVFTIVDQIINTGVRQSITASSRVLNTETATWLSSIVYSPQVYTRVTPEIFIPMLLNTSSTAIKDSKRLDGVNIQSYSFKLSENFTPDFKL
jgi:hypothetical protein